MSAHDDDLDPRIKDELETLNAASDKINTLEKELDEARGKFRMTLTESTTKLNQLHKQNRKSIERAKGYYSAYSIAKKTQAETQNAAVQFRRSSSVYTAAKETLTLAEQRLRDEGIEFTEAWQEMLNHSTMKMMDAEKEKMRSELEHHRKSQAYQQAELQVQSLEKKNRRSIVKAKTYYEMKTNLETVLQQQKQNVDDLLRGVKGAKAAYKSAMGQLEKISEEIHQHRYEETLPVREPGVGCESTEEFAEDVNLDKYLDITSAELDLDDISTDTDSLFSFDSGSVKLPHPHDDVQSFCSEELDSAFCSPKSLSLNSRSRSPQKHLEDFSDITLSDTSTNHNSTLSSDTATSKLDRSNTLVE